MTQPSFLFGSSDSTAIVNSADGTSYSYNDLNSLIETEKQAFKSASKPLVFIFADNSFSTALAYLSSISAGAATTLLGHPMDPAARAKLIETYQPDFLVWANHSDLQAFAGEFKDADFETSPIKSQFYILQRRVSPKSDIHPDLALLLPTSGSTGSPKLVRLSKKAIESNASAIRAALSISKSDTAVTSLPLHYSYGLSVLNSHLHAGAKIVLTNDSVLTKEFWSTFNRYECTSIAGVPYTYQMLYRLNIDNFKPTSLATMTQAGGRLDEKLVTHFSNFMKQRHGQFYVMYGQTEATARISVLSGADLPAKLGSVGRAIPGGEINIETQAAVRDSEPAIGEIVYSGPNTMMGYATQRNELSLGDETGGVLRTGDLGYKDKDGFLYITGRSNRYAKIFGLRINLDDVEHRLRNNGPCAVINVDDKIIAFCEFGTEDQLNALRLELANQLRLNVNAISLKSTTNIPTAVTGKIDYERLRQSYEK